MIMAQHQHRIMHFHISPVNNYIHSSLKVFMSAYHPSAAPGSRFYAATESLPAGMYIICE